MNAGASGNKRTRRGLWSGWLKCAAVGLVCAGVDKVHAGLVLNGDFETGDFTHWDASGSAFVGSELQYLTAGATGEFPVGDYVVNFGGADTPPTGVISQTIQTDPGQEYALIFHYGRFQPGLGGPQSIRVQLIDRDTFPLTTLIDETVTDPSAQIHLPVLFTPHRFDFTATGTSATLSFSDVSAQTDFTDGTLDNITVVEIPEPAGLVVVGLGVLACRRRD